MRENKHNSLEKYMKLYKINKEEDEKYSEKKYPKRMTPKDIEVAQSKFAHKGQYLEKKHILIMVMMICLMLILLATNAIPRSNTTLGLYIFLFFLLYVAFMYNVNSKFYWTFLVLFILVFLYTKNFNFINLPPSSEGSNSNNKK